MELRNKTKGNSQYFDIEIYQRYRAKTLRSIAIASWFVSNNATHDDFSIQTVKDKIKRCNKNWTLRNHSNMLPMAARQYQRN